MGINSFTKYSGRPPSYFVIEEMTIHSWWVVIYLLLSYALYEKAIYHHEITFSQLHHKFIELEQEKQQALALKQELKLQINSQSDPAWIELSLMRKLGLVPEGQTKVYFTQPQTLISHEPSH
jgi:hypothetical protein